MITDIQAQIRSITLKLIESGLSIGHNFPKRDGSEITWEGYRNLSFVLKDEPYRILYDNVVAEKDYNIMFIDGSVIQLSYKFHKRDIAEHILLYLPNPSDEKYVDSPEDFEENNYGEKLFTENSSENYVAFPIRFDYNMSSKIFKEITHPYSHATLGNYQNCRIPVISPISPYRFIRFILTSFYSLKYNELFEPTFLDCPIKIVPTITNRERNFIHFGYS